MTELLTAKQMRHLEQAAMDSGAVTGLELMERAGTGVVGEMMSNWPELENEARSALVLCGPGNNGGDGFVIARLLKARGWSLSVYLFGDADRLPADARSNYDAWCELGMVSMWDPEAIAAEPQADVVVDAVFGTGLTRSLPDDVSKGLSVAGQGRKNARRVAVDCPSGLDADTGVFLRPEDLAAATEPVVNRADLTVTFHSPKPGHYLQQGPSLCGALRIVDIGLRGEAMERAIIGTAPDCERARLAEPWMFGAQGRVALPARFWPLGVLPKAGKNGHKYDFGNVFVFAGGVGRGGAARLAARAALRVGAGLVTVICPAAALQENAARLDAVMLRGLRTDQPVREIADDRATGFCLGPGMGVGSATVSRVEEVLARGPTDRDDRAPVVVLDADALTSFSRDPAQLWQLVSDRTILTPHAGEFARLFPDISAKSRNRRSKIDMVREAADRAGCVVLLKGPDTVIAAPGGGAVVHAASYQRAAPWLATAGAGDVLAGLILGLAASPLAPDLIVSAEAAVWLHVEAARTFGPGLIAEDLPEMMPKVLSGLKDQGGAAHSS